jgi:hypothetical protein
MSALGQKQTYAPQKAMAALPRIAIAKANSYKSHVRFTLESGRLCCHGAVRPGRSTSVGPLKH